LISVVVSQEISPFAMCSKTIYSVIIFVILAGGNASSASFAYKTFPVSTSTIIAVFAFVSIVFAASVMFGCKTTKHATVKMANITSFSLYLLINSLYLQNRFNQNYFITKM